MTVRPTTVLVVGATGSIGRLVVEESIRYGYATRALVRDPAKARILPPEADVVVGDVTPSRDALARCGRSGRRGVHARVGRRGQGWGGKGRLRRRAQRLERSRLADREDRADDVHRGHEPYRHVQPGH
jgi:NAD(P)H-binding